MFQQLQLLKRMTLACGWLQEFAGRRFLLLLCGEKVSTKSAMGHLKSLLLQQADRKWSSGRIKTKKQKNKSCHQEIVEYQLSIQIQGLF
jgi:hypothetical protein